MKRSKFNQEIISLQEKYESLILVSWKLSLIKDSANILEFIHFNYKEVILNWWYSYWSNWRIFL